MSHRPFHSNHDQPTPPADLETLSEADQNVLLKQQLAATQEELAKTQQKLAQIETLYSAAFYSSAHLASFSVVETGRFIDVNQTWCETRGFTREEAIGKTAVELRIWGDNPENRTKIMEEITRFGRFRNFEAKAKMRNGDIRDFLMNGEVIEVDGEKIVFFSGVDITEHKLIMQNQQRSQRLEAIGQLSGGIAHDFNNLLAIIQGNLELLSEQIGPDNNQQKLLSAAISSAQRGAKVTSKLLSFAAKHSSGSEVIDPTDIILHMKELIAKSMTAAINLETTLQDHLWQVDVDASDLEDAIINLCLNARDAMPNGGLLTITTENAEISQNYARLNPPLTVGDYVAIKVSDNGVGLSDELREHIFEPFFTTKSKGQGTGLGLSMVFGFVKRSGGHITVDSTLNEGCEFTLYLPRSNADRSPEITVEKKPASLIPGTEKILVVDDEAGLVEIAQQTLESLGYTVYATTEANTALDLLDKHPDIELLFSDIVMPGGMNGFELAAAALVKNANIKVQLTSGFARAEDLVTADSDPKMMDLKNKILPKPYRIAELANAIRTAIDAD